MSSPLNEMNIKLAESIRKYVHNNENRYPILPERYLHLRNFVLSLADEYEACVDED
jgi:hypothetical protein